MNVFNRIVHLDLKGAPLRIPYLEKVMLSAQSWGATGFLLEWEDTFPYTGELADVGSEKDCSGEGMYSMAEVLHIFQFARSNGMEAIQLVQTIGHLEYVLKHPAFRGLREIPNSPAVLCPTRDGSKGLIRRMVDQALEAQPDARYFHIGADEVWHKGECPECRMKCSNKKFQSDELFLEYIQDLTLYLKEKRPGLTILMWDDMLRNMHDDAIKEYVLKDIQLVYWNYNTIEHFSTNVSLWQKYTKFFPKVWAGSAFKGANGSNQALSPVSRYVSNHDAWLREFMMYGNSVEFVGIIITGWSRYDHYATLCELMPVMLPSLASCLRVITKSGQVSKNELVRELLPPHEWAGETLARCIHTFVLLRERSYSLLHGDQVGTWLNPWQVERGYTVCVHVQNIAYTARTLLDKFNSLHSEMLAHLNAITGKRSTDEWLRTNITPLQSKLMDLINMADSAMSRDAAVCP